MQSTSSGDNTTPVICWYAAISVYVTGPAFFRSQNRCHR